MTPYHTACWADVVDSESVQEKVYKVVIKGLDTRRPAIKDEASWEVEDQALREQIKRLLQVHGCKVKSVDFLGRDKRSGKGRGFCFAHLQDEASMKLAISLASKDFSMIYLEGHGDLVVEEEGKTQTHKIRDAIKFEDSKPQEPMTSNTLISLNHYVIRNGFIDGMTQMTMAPERRRRALSEGCRPLPHSTTASRRNWLQQE